MARHGKGQAAAAKARDIDTPQIPGGSAGIPSADMEQLPRAAQAIAAEPGRDRKAKAFMVTDGPRDGSGKIPVQYDGYRVWFTPGKIVTEATHDLELLRRQGLRMEAMPEDVTPEQDEAMAEQEAIVHGGEGDESEEQPRDQA